LHDIEAGGPLHIAIEHVGAMPGQGLTSTFRFGMGYGIWLGLVAGLGHPYTLVRPQIWKPKMMGGRGRDKSAARLRAIELFPAMADQLARVKDDGRAEALLLCEWLRREGA
jgi:crossover junction endodeoxyribonuclease RuvC